MPAPVTSKLLVSMSSTPSAFVSLATLAPVTRRSSEVLLPMVPPAQLTPCQSTLSDSSSLRPQAAQFPLAKSAQGWSHS